jgi:AcrR family transcriptional regulator
MKKVKRMNDQKNTANELVAAAVELFGRHGYDGTSVRAITANAGANLGAITYHFGSKETLYEAALASVTEPFRELIVKTANGPGDPLLRIERIVRVFFHYLNDFPELPNLISQQLAGSRAMPAVTRETLQHNLRTLTAVIAEGQKDGSIRSGNPRDLALSVASQPMWLTLARRVLMEGAGLDQDDPSTHELIVESVVQFVRAGLTKHQEGKP